MERPKPNPQPPTTEQAARILNEAWQDPDWAVLIWLTMVTGFRRGELCAIRWRHLDLAAGVLMLEEHRAAQRPDVGEEHPDSPAPPHRS